MRFGISGTLFGTILAVAAVAESSAASPPTGERVDFELSDFRGAQHQLSNHAEKPVVVLAFLGTDCPLVKLYAVRLQQFADMYADRGVVVIGVNSNRQDSITEIAAFARTSGITFPILKDTGNVLADELEVQRTPEVVVLDQNRQVRYSGRIDDQYGIGYARSEPEATWLADAVESLLAGNAPTTAHVAAEGCLIGRIRETQADAAVTYSSHVAAIMNRHCVSCHREGEIAPFTLTSYDDVAGWADMIREVVTEQRMPPWHADPAIGHFANARGLTDEEKAQLTSWSLAGAPAGDLTSLPRLPKKPDAEWHLGKAPDVVISMGQQFRIPAEGVVDYEYISVDPGFTEDRWVKAAEIIPGNRGVVHHVLVFARAPRDRRSDPGAGGGSFLAGYVPGLVPTELPDGMAKLVPAGSTLVFQMHYTPNGTEQIDESSIGLYLADESDVDHVVITQEAVQRRFRIPAGDPAYRVDSRSAAAPVDVQLLGMMPHMHVRGKSFTYTAVSPDGSEESLLRVPNYDFNWQTSYRLAEPMTIPAGTWMSCVAHFDNSAANLNNPDPTVSVGWGDQTWNEMMIGYFDIAVPRSVAASGGAEPSSADRLLARYDGDRDGKIQRNEIPDRLESLFDRLDTNKDGELTKKELAPIANFIRR